MVESTPTDLLGPNVPVPDATRTGTRFFGRTSLENFIEDPNFGVTTLAAWFLVFASLGVGLSVLVFRATESVFFSALPLPAMLWLGWILGTPIPYWLPLVFTLVVLSFTTGVKRFARA